MKSLERNNGKNTLNSGLSIEEAKVSTFDVCTSTVIQSHLNKNLPFSFTMFSIITNAKAYKKVN